MAKDEQKQPLTGHAGTGVATWGGSVSAIPTTSGWSSTPAPAPSTKGWSGDDLFKWANQRTTASRSCGVPAVCG